MALLVSKVSGRDIDNKDFLKTQPNSSCRHGDTLQKHVHDVYIRKWKRYASERKVDKVSPPLSAAVNFQASLAESDLSNSAVCTASSALSSYLCTYMMGCRLEKMNW